MAILSPSRPILATRSRRPLTRFAWFVVFYNVLVILWGSLVRATGSGAGCGNHWPLCNGQVIPISPTWHTIIEFTHRQMVTGSTFAILALLIWILRTTPKRHPARWFAIASTVLLFNEAFLGALLVKLGYVTNNQSAGRMIVLSIHLSNTLLLLAALTLTARFLADPSSPSPAQHSIALHRAPGFGWGITGLLATIAVGVSGSMAALGDTLFPATSLRDAYLQDFTAHSPWLLRLRLIHPISALLAALLVLWLIRRAHQQSLHTRRLAAITVSLLALQFALGIADVLLLAPAWMQLLHLLGADLYWIALVLLTADTIWSGVPSRSEIIAPATQTAIVL